MMSFDIHNKRTTDTVSFTIYTNNANNVKGSSFFFHSFCPTMALHLPGCQRQQKNSTECQDVIITRCAIAHHNITGDTSLNREIANFDPSLRNQNLTPITTTFVTIKYIGEVTAPTNLTSGAFWAYA